MSAMNTHKRYMHWIVTDCDKCWSTCKSKISFKIHEWNVHDDVYLECEKCGNDFKSKTKLKKQQLKFITKITVGMCVETNLMK